MGIPYFRVFLLFTVGNGVRQGSILSSNLFAVYVDDLSVNLIDSGQGCCIDNVFINHLFYADDLCLMAPSPSALQRLINICDQFCIDNDLVFNPGESICMFIKPPRCKLKCPNLYIGNICYLHILLNILVFFCVMTWTITMIWIANWEVFMLEQIICCENFQNAQFL